ncbi:DUF11 domain-containing protein [Fibrella sp. HMF5335]|uniref:DUF11 domain-containing protein n=1 Tax=Fibrella rubiginis TaxID=2817060 RepID=A0A939GBW3_9BACT|nr:SdrD B-like domain-containing protein [Fibrella rubiginis]MBO0934948.1 DUF11 domain-containing protein [Fibrella rubiginis]
MTGLLTGAFAQTGSQVNLSLTKSISNASPALGQVVTYTVAVTNTGSATATSVVVSDSMAMGYSTVLSSTASVGTYSSTAATGLGIWTIGSIAPSQTVTLLVSARVDAEGVAFNAAEVKSMDGTDANSVPGNGDLLEDDYDNACFSVPITWYPGDEYTVDKPTGFTSFTWLAGGQPVSASSTVASVDANGNLVIKGPGIFSFAATRNACPVSNCCNIIVQPGATAGLGNYVFEDKNADGIQNGGDLPIQGVLVTLYQNGSAVATTTTDASGLYSFTGLTPGSSNSYAVGFTTPTGFTAASPLVGGNGAVDSDVNPITGKTASVTLAPGEVNPDLDAGYIKPASLGDYVFNDKNKDGVQNAGDTPIQGVLVTLYQNGSAVATTTSDAAGAYSFTGLTPGAANVYQVKFATPASFASTSANVGFDGLDSDADPVTGLTQTLTLTSGESNTSVDAGFYQPTASLGDYVFEDKNANGIQDAGDMPISGVLVTLYSNGSAVGTTTTSASGLYSFTGLTPGVSYTVGFGKPAGFVPTLANVLSGTAGDGADSDANPITGLTGAYSLSANEFNSTVDAGFYKPASLGDYVFTDVNRDGVQNAGDTPLPGVVVTLYQNGSAVATTTTNASGLYSFTGLTPGAANVYQVGFAKPAGLASTSANVGSDGLDSDADPVTGLTQTLTLTSGESNTSVDAGFYQPTAGLGDYVFEDKNADGIQNGGDLPIQGVLVTLFQNGSAVATTTTNAAGFYSFTGLTPGSSNSYVVGFAKPAGFATTTPLSGTDAAKDSNADLVTGKSQSVTLAADEFNATIDAGYVKPASIGDYVFNDTNKDGVQNAGDSPISGVLVTLYLNGSAVGTTTTDASGAYSFTGLTPGAGNVYQVGFTAPTNFSSTSANIGSDGLDSDADPVTGLTQTLTLTSGESNTSVDAGYFRLTAGLGDYVFEDKNANGIQDAGDMPISGVLVTLYSNGSAVGTTLTDVSGLYSFTGLTPGVSYTVGFGKPAGFVATIANVGSDTADSDANPTTGLTGAYSLSANEFNSTVDAGFFRPASIGDYVFNDTNKDGVQNGGDTPLAGVVVTLYQNGSAVATTTTNASGLYSFTGLTPGAANVYQVGFTTPTNFSTTTPLSGTDKALDSDANPITGLTGSVTLTSGESNTTFDAGFYQLTAGLGDYVFEDKNANGIQDAGDMPISGVLVTLYTNGSAVGTTTTSASGLYSFTGLTPGVSYTVGFGKPAGFVPTLANVLSGTAGDGADSDASPITGLTGAYSLSATEFNSTVDAGFYKPASLGDYVFTDVNRDGVQNAGDTPLAGVVVTLYQNGSAVATTTTNASGLYSFTGLTPGAANSYVVGFTPPAGYSATSPLSGTDKALDSDVNPLTGKSGSVTLTSGETNSTVDAGFYQPTAGLGDYVFFDTDKDGLQTPDDFPLEDILVTLFQNGSAVATTLTNPDGFYSFTGLTPGSSISYSVGFTTPLGLTATMAHVGSDGTIDSDLDPITGRSQSVTLAIGEFNSTLDAGFMPTEEPPHDSPVMASLGDYVFLDNNKDGIQNAGDAPIQGVKVTLYLNGTAVATTLTDISGLYSFTGLNPGNNRNYVVGFTTPANMTATLTNVGSDTADSDANPITGMTQSVTLLPGENNTTLDAGFYQPTAGLGDYVFEDKNANGIQDAGDMPIPNVLVTLYTNGSAVGTTTTSASGLYSFTGLTPGVSYTVSFGKPAGFVPTLANVLSGTAGDGADSDASPITGLTGAYSLSANEFNPTVDAGFFRPASIGDYVFNDTNKDGVQNGGDTPLAGVVVTLYQNGSAVATTTTNASGLYSFTGLTPGAANVYQVGFTTPTNFSTTTPLSGTDKALDSDANPITGLTGSVTLTSGESNTTFDAGFYQLTAGLGDYVFEDKNVNGIQDAGDVPIPGVVVTLYAMQSPMYSVGEAIKTTTTDINGLYSFTGLTPGVSYSVGFGTPAGYTVTVANVGNDTKDSDANHAYVSDWAKALNLTEGYILAPNEFNPTVDAGFYKPASLGDYVFTDVNRDGVQNAGDTPLAGVVVTLYQNGSAVATTTTNASGLYSFTGLTPGAANSYVVGFTPPAGYSATSPLSGTDKALDSDVNPLTGKSGSVTLTSGETNSTVDAGFYQPTAGLGDYVFEDKNLDGIQNGGDVPISGVLVTLYLNGSAVATTTTNGAGLYSFTGLTSGPANNYVVGFAKPAGFGPTLSNVGSDTADSDADGATGKTQSVTLAPGEFNSTLDAGFFRTASIGDYVFVDTDKSGTQTPGDKPLQGVIITLYQNGSAVATTMSDVNGAYSFTGLTPGSSNTYSVGFAKPSGFNTTTAGVGGNPTLDSDPDPVTGRTTGFTLSNGESNTTIDAGYAPQSAGLGDYVFEDKNANGTQDAGDMPIPNVLVTLYTNGSAVATTLTSSSGMYSFTGLTPGTPYYVGFGKPAGFTPTAANLGDDTKDSDADVTTGFSQTVTLASEEYNLTIDAGFYRPASLGDYVFVDNNRDGVQNAGDAPMPGVVVTLYLNGSAVATTTTNGSGAYSFTGLAPGTTNVYQVGFAKPAGFDATSANVGFDGLDSDADPITGRAPSLTLSSGESNTSVDAGFLPQLGAIGDFVWFDYNSDGQQAPVGEPGVPNLLITLFQSGSAIRTTLTDANGKYLFSGLGSGQYTVKFTAPVGSVFTTKNRNGVPTDLDSDAGADGLSDLITIDVTQPISSTARVNLTIDAGIVPYGSIGNYVWRDTNNNGLQDDGPTGIPNVKVQLFTSTDLTNPLDETVTDGSGYYLFTQLIAGNYKVKFTLPTGEVFTLQTQGGDRGIDSNPGADGLSDVIPISTSLALGNVGRDNLTIDAGVKAKCSTPLVLVASATNSSICVGDMTSVSATASGATVIRWYLAAIGDAVAFTSASGQTVPVDVSTTTTYYVEAETADGCKSERKPVTIIVNARPNTPSCIKEVNVCQDAFYDLTKVKLNNVPLPGSTLEWHTGKSETSPLVTNLTAVSAGEYFLFERSKFGCYSYPTVLTVNQIDCRCTNLAVVSTTLTSGSACAGGPITLIASMGGSATGVTWMTSTSTSTGTLTMANSLTAYYMPSAADIAAGTVQFAVMTNDPDGSGYCVPAKSSVVVAISPRPEAPLGAACEDEILCKGGSTKLFGFTASNGKINWYNKATGILVGTSMNGKPLTVTPTASTTYLAEAVSAAGCVSLTKVEVVVTVKATCLADLAVVKTVLTAGPYKIGDFVSYGILAKNNGPITAKSVTVSDLLPASLEFVSATPAAEFNAGTGVWTVGTLTNGSDRNLIVQARVKGTGMLTNTATIDSPDNDPNMPEDNVSAARIMVDQCAVNPPTIACAVTALCGEGESTVLTARDCDGTITWSNGMTGNRISVTPTATTVYSASCVIGACTSGMSNTIKVTVTDAPKPTILASADKVCVGGVVSLTAVGCENGTVYWSDSMVGSVVSLTISGETLITAQCRVNNCYGKAAEKLIKVGNDLPKPTVICSTTEVCPGETVTLTAQNCTGTPHWSTGETTASITVTPTQGNNSYSVFCSNGANCNSPRSNDYRIRIIPNVIPTVTASTTSICVGGTVSLTASGCEGAVKWSNSMTGSVISVTMTASESFYATCKVRDCVSDPSKSVAVTVGKPQAPTIRAIPNTAICAGESVTLTVAEGCANGTVRWTNTDLTGRTVVVMPGVNTDYTATCVVDGNCISGASNVVKVIVKTAGTAPTIVASSTAVCNGSSVTLTASGCTGTVMWSNNMTGASIMVTPTAEVNSFYAICKQADKCGSPQSRTIKINLSTPPAPTVVCSTSIICLGESVDLTIQNCTGSSLWSTGAADNGKTTITVTPTVTTSYSVICKEASGCTSAPSQLYTITVVPLKPLDISASKTEITLGESVTLTAAGCPVGGVVTWSDNQIGSVIVITPTAAVSFYNATCRYRSCTTDPAVAITIKEKGPDNCAAKAGTLVASTSAVCASSLTTVTLSATDNGGRVVPTGYSVVYVLTKGSELVIQQTSNTPSFAVPATATGIYTIHTLVYDPKTLDLSVVKPGVTTGVDVLNLIQANKLCADLDVAGARTKVNYVPAPGIKGPNRDVQCYGTVVSFTATGCENGTIAWSNGTLGAVASVTVLTDHWFFATCTIDGCTSDKSEMVDSYLARPAVPTVACNKSSVCAGDEATLTAVGCEGGSFLWSNGATGSSLVVTPQLSTTYAVKCVIGKCESAWSPVCSLTVGAPQTPTVTVNDATGTVSTCYGVPVTLTAKGCPAGSYAVWSNNMVGSSITVIPAQSATYSAQCCTSTNCKSQRSNVFTLIVQPKVAQPKTTDLTNVCPFRSVNLANGVGTVTTSGGTFEYYTTSTLEPASKLANTNVTVSGTYYVVEKTTTGCYSLPSMIQVNIVGCGDQLPCGDNPVTANAGKDDQICAAKSYKLAGVISGTNATAQWKTSGTGTFDNAFSPTALYVPSLTDVQAGQVTLTLSVRSNNASCPGQSDQMVLAINGPKIQPVIKVVGSTQLCAGETVKLEAPAGYTYLWSNKATTQSIVVDKSGSYSVQVFDQGLCSSVPSEAVSVMIAAPVPAPLVVNLRNACPASTVSLSAALAGITPTPGSTYEYHISEDPASGSPMTSAVGEGTYYVFERTVSQCLSLPGKVIVKITDCGSNTQTADIQLTKTVSSTAVRTGGMVTYTLTVKNLGPNDATNVDVRDVLPAGLELVPGTAPLAFTVTNGAILKRFESLSANQSASIEINARLTKKGDVINMASITYSDLIDPNADNNTSSVTVSDNAPARTGIIGLAKEVVGTPVMISDKNFVATYRFTVTNYGDDALSNVGITDNLDEAFGTGNVLASEVTTDAANDLDLNPAFTGSGTNTQMLASTSKLAPGETATVVLSLTAVRNDATSSYSNSAVATAANATTLVSDASVSGADADPDGDFDPGNNMSATTFQLDPVTQENGQLGVALNVASTEKQADGSYNVTYQIFAKNFGTTTLTNVSLTDTLAAAFPAPASFSLVGKPTLSVGSRLVLSDDFKGTADSPYLLFSGVSSLSAGQQDVITFTVNVQPGSNNGLFYSTVYGAARPESTTMTVRDRSNPGSTVFPAIDQPTGVRFDLPAALIGMAKEVGDPVLIDQAKKLYDIPYLIKVCNLGTTDLKRVQVVDDLSKTFGNGASVQSVTITADAGLKINTGYTGLGLLTNMLDTTASSLAVKDVKYIRLVARVNMSAATSLTFTNVAVGSGMSGTATVSDVSNAGSNVDPDNDLDPRNNNDGTKVRLNSLPSASHIGVALSVRDTARQSNGSYNVTYRVVVKNYGTVAMRDVSLADTLSKVFNDQVGAGFTVLGTPIASKGSKLKLNPGFNGSSSPFIVLGDSTSQLGVGATDTLLVRINVTTTGQTGLFFNSVYATARLLTSGAKVDSEMLRDVSTNGLNPDLNGNNNPTDPNESEATPLNLPLSDQTVFIPQGFSPNGDGINDLFVIRGVQGLTVSLEVTNRWGHRVYMNEDYKNDWDGKSNTGIQVGNATTDGVPDGTYYYVVKLSDGRQFVRFMTINR